MKLSSNKSSVAIAICMQRLSYTIVFLTTIAHSTLEFAKSQLEWMNQDISEAFNKNKTNPFEFR